MNPAFSPPAPVLSALARLRAAGHEAFLVGGCVRDLLLSLEPADWDVCTSAHPDIVHVLFPGCLDTGLRHGTVTAMMPLPEGNPHRFPIEITTWRAESGYADHRHPDVVSFSSNLETDLARRDFTINAMAWNPERGLIDRFDGCGDLARRLVRCVGDPIRRFEEDALRMLRAIRFCSQLGFELDDPTRQAIRRHRLDLRHVSRERIQHELTRTLTGLMPSKASLWWDTGLDAFLFDVCAIMAQSDPEDIHSLFQALTAGTAIQAAAESCSSEEAIAAVFQRWEADKSTARRLLPEQEGRTDENVEPDPTIFAWSLLFCASHVAVHSNALVEWMKAYRFPNARIAGIRKLLMLALAPSPDTVRNLRYSAMSAGTGWVKAARYIRSLLRMPLASQDGNRPPSADVQGECTSAPLPVFSASAHACAPGSAPSDALAHFSAPSHACAQWFPLGFSVPNGSFLLTSITPGVRPQGPAFGALLECVRMALCERPELLAEGLLPDIARAMRDASLRAWKEITCSKTF